MKFPIAIILLLSTLSQISFADEVFVMPEFGRSDFEFDEEFLFEDSDATENASNATLVFGLTTQSNFVFAGSLSTTASDNLFGANDNYQLYEVSALFGYSINVSEHFRIVPMVGFGLWELDAEEGEFLNPGPEEDREENGTDSFWKINFEFPVNGLVHLNASYINNEYEFGDVDGYRFGIKFVFH